MGRFIWIGLGAALLVGCGASQQVLEEQQAQVKQLQSELAGCAEESAACRDEAGKLQEDLQGCRDEAARARGTVERESKRQDEMRRQLEGTWASAARVKDALEKEVALRRQLQEELRQKTVEIENLQGRLSVRVLARLLFDSGSADIKDAGTGVLAKIGPVLKDGQEMIRVEGHSDDVPVGPGLKDTYFSNWELSAARAASVVRYLQYGLDIDPVRLEAVGLASYRPVADNATDAGRLRNRRVEIVLSPRR